MLREIGKKNKQLEINYLIKNNEIMPRTMLWYAIEIFTINERLVFLDKKRIVSKQQK